jgi:hypothetical protein
MIIIIIYSLILILLSRNEKNIKKLLHSYTYYPGEIKRIKFFYKFNHYFSLIFTIFLSLFMMVFFYFIINELSLLYDYVTFKPHNYNIWKDKALINDIIRFLLFIVII